MVQLHDTGYKFLFSHAELVRELLEVFAPAGVSERLDYATLRRESGSFITPAMKKREDDIVWSIELAGQRIYLYLLLEFQSSIDRGMPVRIMQYVAALYDHLLRSKAVDLNDGLPPVLPIVLYNGQARWRHSPEVFDLIQPHPAALSAFQPHLRFWLIDEGRFSPAYLEGLERVMAAIFRMEHFHDTESVKAAISYLGRSIAQSPYKKAIDKVVVRWVLYRLSHAIPGMPAQQIEELLREELLKGSDMLEENMARILADVRAEGALMGKIEGKREGQLEGMLKGKLEGKLEGESTLLERQIAKRFGPVTDDTRSRLRTATGEQLETWAERILDAQTLAEVFQDH